MDPQILVAFGDLHGGSVSGLCPPKVQLDSGGYYYANQFQLYTWGLWNDMWDKIAQVIRSDKVEMTAVCLGETLDKNKYSKNGVFAHNPNSMLRAADEVFAPIKRLTDKLYILRATEAHEGEEAWLAEAIAERLKAIPRAKHNYSWWHIAMSVSGVRFDIKHHPESGDMRWWTAGGGMIRSANQVAMDYVDSLMHLKRRPKFSDLPPHVVIRAHTHRWRDSGTNLPIRAITVPAWQGATPFVHRIGAGGSRIPDFGCAYFRCENREFEMNRIKYKPERNKMEVIE